MNKGQGGFFSLILLNSYTFTILGWLVDSIVRMASVVSGYISSWIKYEKNIPKAIGSNSQVRAKNTILFISLTDYSVLFLFFLFRNDSRDIPFM